MSSFLSSTTFAEVLLLKSPQKKKITQFQRFHQL
uniref:Uncharacterized protein n=1 Tax=Rhizophora mucronata TaxID=61149 RepID=A0A2P2IUN4_RHIMU